MIKITPKQKQTISPKYSPKNLAVYSPIQTTDIYKNTWLKTVYFHSQVIEEIEIFVTNSLANPPVHEVGGFLLGYQGLSQAIFVEKFIPAKKINYSSPSRLNFGTGAIQELAEALDTHKELILVGWFHTHTAAKHPFLSSFDLRIQDGFFTAPYQIAVVIDSMTQHFQSGVFTRQQNGVMNNISDIQNNYLIKWSKIRSKSQA